MTLSQGNIGAAEGRARELLRVAEASDDPDRRLWAEHALAGSLANLGHFEEALDHALALRDVGRERPELFARPKARAALTMVAIYQGLAAVQLCEHDLAEEAWREQLESAEAPGGNLFEVALALTNAATVLIWQSDATRLRPVAARLGAVAEETGMELFRGWADLYGGWAMAMTGDLETGIAALISGIETHLRQGQVLGVGGYFARLAEAQLAAGDVVGALASVDQSLGMRSEQRWPRVEVLRIQGHILERSDIAAARACYLDALELGRQFDGRLLVRAVEADLQRLEEAR